MAEIKIDLGIDEGQGDTKDDIILQELTKGLPSTSSARYDAVRRAPRTQIHFSNIPLPVKEAFEKAAKKNNMGLKEYFYHCLRAGGADIPNYQELDARRR